MSERILISLAVLALLGLSPLALQLYRRRVIARPVSAAAMTSLSTLQPEQMPTILYFTTPTCSQCRLQQAPALEKVQQSLGDRIIIRKIDAVEAPELVAQYGVMTVPTTVLLDRRGQAVEINYGLAPTTKLRQQLEAIL